MAKKKKLNYYILNFINKKLMKFVFCPIIQIARLTPSVLPLVLQDLKCLVSGHLQRTFVDPLIELMGRDGWSGFQQENNMVGLC